MHMTGCPHSKEVEKLHEAKLGSTNYDSSEWKHWREVIQHPANLKTKSIGVIQPQSCYLDLGLVI